MTSVSRSIPLRCILALGALAIVAGCGPDDSPSSATVRPEEALHRGSGSYSHTIRVAEGVDIADIADQYDLDVVLQDDDTGMAGFDPPPGFDAVDLQQNQDIISVGPAVPTSLSGPVNNLISFYAGENGPCDGADALSCLNLPSVHQIATARGALVAVLDTGIDDRHPDLAGHLAIHEVPTLGSPYEYDDGNMGVAFGHGTHVAGTILAIAPAATIMPFRVLNDDGVGDDYQLAVGIRNAITYGAQIINMSLVVDGASELVDSVLDDAIAGGIIVIAAAGNDPTAGPSFPASKPNVYAIGATRPVALGDCRTLAGYSASGALVQFAAVGSDVASAYPLDVNGVVRHACASGTSMASAVTAGSAALLLTSPTTRADPMKALKLNAEPIIPSGAVVYGLVSPAKALGRE